MNKNSRHIGVFTGSRAEFGLLKPILDALLCDSSISVSLIVSGSHIGETESEIALEGYQVSSKVPFKSAGISHSSAIGSLITSITPELERIRPDILLVYGDRFETFAAAVAASQMPIPVAQIEAGDRTDGGSLDDSVRHAITKLSHLFFTSNSEASNRVLQLGEEDWRVHTVGLTTIDLIKNKDYTPISELQFEFKINLETPIILFTQHSVTPDPISAKKDISSTIAALEEITNQTSAHLIITGANTDIGGDEINKALESFSKKHKNSTFVRSLGRRRYHGFLNWCVDSSTAGGVCVGNSSSGIKEAIAFGCPAVNIGERQLGRLAPQNVIQVAQEPSEIIQGINKGLFDQEFRKECLNFKNPYGSGNAGKTISKVLKDVDIKLLLNKKFIDRHLPS